MPLAVKACPLILLAAGRSTRMGVPKGLLPVGGRPWLMEQLLGFREGGGREAIVVLGFHQDAYTEEIPWIREALGKTVRIKDLEISVVMNPQPGRGQFSSLQCAVASLGETKREGETGDPLREKAQAGSPGIGRQALAVFVLPIDVPCPGKEVWERLTEAFRPPLAAVIPRYREKGGHPVLLSASFLDRLKRLPLDDPAARLDFQIKALPPEALCYVEVEDPRIVLNINTPEQFNLFSTEVKSP